MQAVLTIIGGLVLLTGLALLVAWPTELLVNYLFTPSLIAAVFGAAQLTFWKAFFLNWLCAGLFKSTSTTTTNK
jgi:hypothetical protein